MEIVAAAVAKGIKPHLAVEIAEHIQERLQLAPDAFRPLGKAERNARIQADFDGSNHVEICTLYRISRATLYRILQRPAAPPGPLPGP